MPRKKKDTKISIDNNEGLWDNNEDQEAENSPNNNSSNSLNNDLSENVAPYQMTREEYAAQVREENKKYRLKFDEEGNLIPDPEKKEERHQPSRAEIEEQKVKKAEREKLKKAAFAEMSEQYAAFFKNHEQEKAKTEVRNGIYESVGELGHLEEKLSDTKNRSTSREFDRMVSALEKFRQADANNFLDAGNRKDGQDDYNRIVKTALEETQAYVTAKKKRWWNNFFGTGKKRLKDAKETLEELKKLSEHMERDQGKVKKDANHRDLAENKNVKRVGYQEVAPKEERNDKKKNQSSLMKKSVMNKRQKSGYEK